MLRVGYLAMCIQLCEWKGHQWTRRKEGGVRGGRRVYEGMGEGKEASLLYGVVERHWKCGR